MTSICKCSFCRNSVPTKEGGFTCRYGYCTLSQNDLDALIEKIFSKN